MSSGIFNTVGLGKESSYGVPVAPTVFIPIKESDGVQINMDTQFVEAIKGTAPKNKDAFTGKVEMTGGFESDLYPLFVGNIINSAMGNVVSALESGESSVYKHTFTENTSKPSYTIEQKFGEIIKRFQGYIVRTFSIEGKAGEAVSFNFEGFAQNQANASPTTPTYETSRTFNFRDFTSVKIGSVDVTAKTEEVSLEYDNALEAFYAVGDNYQKSLYPGQSECKGKIMLYLDNNTKDFLEDYIAGTHRSIEIKIEGDTIGTASKNTMKALVARAAITSVSTKLSFDYNALELEFEAVEDPTDGILKVELINSIPNF